MTESRIGPKVEQPTFNCNICSKFSSSVSSVGPVAQSVECWTLYGGSIRPGFKSLVFEVRRAPDVYQASWWVWLLLVAGRSQSKSVIGINIFFSYPQNIILLTFVSSNFHIYTNLCILKYLLQIFICKYSLAIHHPQCFSTSLHLEIFVTNLHP